MYSVYVFFTVSDDVSRSVVSEIFLVVRRSLDVRSACPLLVVGVGDVYIGVLYTDELHPPPPPAPTLGATTTGGFGSCTVMVTVTTDDVRVPSVIT